MSLIVLPHAGGNARSYEFLKKFVDVDVEVVLVEYPGRGARSREPLVDDMNRLVDDVYRQIKGIWSRGPYVVLGHSMGANVGMLLIRKILSLHYLNRNALPVQLFASGVTGPSALPARHIADEPDSDVFWKMFAGDGGVDQAILDCPELRDYLEPIFRNDCRAFEKFARCAKPKPLRLPITVLTGTRDVHYAAREVVEETWQRETALPVESHEFEGGHFFLWEHPQAYASIISETISTALTGRRSE